MFRVSVLFRAASLACLAAFPVFTIGSPAEADGMSRARSGPSRPLSWTGFYVGVHGNYTWADIEHPKAPPHPAGPPRQTLDGGFVGGQIGYNHQFHSIVLGVEVDIAKGNITGTVRDGNYITQTDTIDLIATVRGRIGYAMGPFMPYLTAGVMWDRGERGQQCPDPAAVPFGHCRPALGFAPYNLSEKQWHSGFVWGGGVEYAINQHWSLKVEGLVAKMGEETYVLGPAANGQIANVSVIEHDIVTAKVGINTRF